MKKILACIILSCVTVFTAVALPPDPIGQLRGALGKKTPAAALRLSRTQYSRDIESDFEHRFVQNYDVTNGAVITSSFHWIGNVGYVTARQGELFDLTDPLGEPIFEDDKSIVWADGNTLIAMMLVYRGDDGYFHLEFGVSMQIVPEIHPATEDESAEDEPAADPDADFSETDDTAPSEAEEYEQ
jgi:hypothetical protein